MDDTNTPPERSESEARAERIGQLNDHLRQNNSNPFGHDLTLISHDLNAKIEAEASDLEPEWFLRGQLRKAVALFDSFEKGNDPYGERDFGSFDFRGTQCFWKIDYYNPDLTGGSSDPVDPSVTARVLTIATMLEY